MNRLSQLEDRVLEFAVDHRIVAYEGDGKHPENYIPIPSSALLWTRYDQKHESGDFEGGHGRGAAIAIYAGAAIADVLKLGIIVLVGATVVVGYAMVTGNNEILEKAYQISQQIPGFQK